MNTLRARQTAARAAQLVALCTALGTLLVPSGGCSMAALAMYAIRGNDVPAAFEGLEEKRVAVVCRPTASLQYANATVSKNLARDVAARLSAHIKKIVVIDPAEIEKWTDENDWQEYREVGKAVKADMVVGIDLESFSLYQGQTIFQGKADSRLVVYDLKKSGQGPVFEKVLPQSVYPPTNGVATSDLPESEFRREFVARIAEEVARHFYPHDPYSDVGLGPRRF